MLADVFQNFQNMCLEIYELDPANSLSAAGLAWQAVLKKTKVKLDLLTDIGMLRFYKKNYNEESNKVYFREAAVQYLLKIK